MISWQTFRDAMRDIHSVENKKTEIISRMFIKAGLEAVFGFTGYLLTMVIIDMLQNHISMSAVFLATICGALIITGLFLTIQKCKHTLDYRTQVIEAQVRLQISEKSVLVPFCVQEGYAFKENLREIQESDMWMGGISQLVHETDSVIRAVLRIIISLLSLILSLCIVIRSHGNMLMVIAVFGVILLTAMMNILLHTRIQNKNTKQIMALFQKVQEANGGGMAFISAMSDYHVGKDIRLYQFQNRISDEIERIRTDPEGISLYKDLSRKQGMIPGILSLLSAAIQVLAYSLIGWFAYAGFLSLGSIVVIAGAMIQISEAISELTVSLGKLKEKTNMFKPYRNMLSLPEEKREIEKSDDLGLFDSVALEQVTFSYPGTNEPAIENISLRIQKGEKIALVGPNGSGKSTLIKLLCGLYQPDQGKIVWNGQNRSDMPKEIYLKQISPVFQDFHLSSLSVGENICAGEKLIKSKAEQSLKKAGINKESALFSTETMLYHDFDPDGIEISGGEAQKLALARAFYREGSLLLLDEPTSAFDPKVEADFYNRVETESSDQTIVFVSHRLASCKQCERIIVMDHHQIVQTGAHEDLILQKEGLYYKLWNAQAEMYSQKEIKMQ